MEKKIFNNTKQAFKLKDDGDINRSLFIFKMISHPWLVSIGIWLTRVSLKLHLPVEGIIRKTIFNQFCGGETQKECLPVVKQINEMNVFTVFDYASEIRGDDDSAFDRDTENILEICDFAAEHEEIPFVVIKPSGMGLFSIWEKVTADEELTDREQELWGNIERRVESVCKRVYDLGIRVLVDAEESWIQGAADELVERMMEKYNKDRTVVFGTVQCYRWDRLQYIKDINKRAREKGFKVGMKIVRGAYMEKENTRAQKLGYPTPICEDKEATDVNFNTIMLYIMQHLDNMSIYIGTHNEVSSYLATQIIREKAIEKDDDRIWFSQLYGMSDHITFNLAMEGYNAAKFMPFGKVKEVVPYLIRRAEENSSVAGQTGRELALLEEEKRRRKGTYVKRID